MRRNRLVGVFKRHSRAQGFVLVSMVAGLLPVVDVALTSPYEAIALFGVWGLYSFFLTTVGFAKGSNRQRTAFAISFVGAYLMLLVPILVVAYHYPILPSGGCFQDPIGERPYSCWGIPVSVYYATINRLVLAGIAAVFASLLYATHPRGHVMSGIIMIFASGAYVVAILSTQLPVPVVLLLPMAGAGSLLTFAYGSAKSVKRMEPSFPGQIISILTRPIGTLILVGILLAGVIGGAWGYANEAASGLEITCVDRLSGSGLASNAVLGITNPSDVSVDSVWKITLNYTSAHWVLSDIESFHVPAHSTSYPHFVFQGLDLQGAVVVNSTYPLIITYEQRYNALLWSFNQSSSFVWTSGGFSAPIGGRLTPC